MPRQAAYSLAVAGDEGAQTMGLKLTAALGNVYYTGGGGRVKETKDCALFSPRLHGMSPLHGHIVTPHGVAAHTHTHTV